MLRKSLNFLLLIYAIFVRSFLRNPSIVLSKYRYLDIAAQPDGMLASLKVPGIDGLYVSVGQSEFGLGLFATVSKEVGSVNVSRGSALCDYLPGEFNLEKESDKAVGFGFYEEHDIHSWVYYDDKLMHLWEAVYKSNDGGPVSDLPGKLEGHFISVENGGIQITKNSSYNKTRFVPIENSADVVSLKLNFASYANDMAFQLGVTTSEDLYKKNYDNNCLMLVWKLAENDFGVLCPVNPILVTKTDLIFSNEAVEVGVGYGWDYWLAQLAKRKP